jgi:hypothetical protein
MKTVFNKTFFDRKVVCLCFHFKTEVLVLKTLEHTVRGLKLSPEADGDILNPVK